MEAIKGIKLALTGAVAFLSYIFGGSDLIFKVLIIFIVFDYLTGIAAAIYTKTLNSQTGFKGIIKKLIILTVVAISHWAGLITGAEMIRTVVISFYIANEGISIMENAVRCDIPVPDKLKELLEQLKNGDKE